MMTVFEAIKTLLEIIARQIMLHCGKGWNSNLQRDIKSKKLSILNCIFSGA